MFKTKWESFLLHYLSVETLIEIICITEKIAEILLNDHQKYFFHLIQNKTIDENIRYNSWCYKLLDNPELKLSQEFETNFKKLQSSEDKISQAIISKLI
jgi:hypothetical protein